MKTTSPEVMLPLGIGVEEETMMMVGPAAGDYTDFVEPVDFVQKFNEFIPHAIKRVSENDSTRKFLQNGALVYNGGAVSSPYIERATPECAYPLEVATHVQANEDLLIDMVGSYVRKKRQHGENRKVRIQRRVIDSTGNTRGCHDNIELRVTDPWEDFLITEQSAALLHYLATRSFITGAGSVDRSGLHFSQKARTVDSLSEYGYNSSAIRVIGGVGTDTGHRLEVRCSDINISPWAIQMRVGSAALMVAMLQTSLHRRLTDNNRHYDVSERARIRHFHRYSHVPVQSDGQLRRTKNLLHALDYQERIWDVADQELDKYVQVPEAYQTIIHELQYYCQDFRRVLYGELDLAELADRSDVAAKFTGIFRSLRAAEAAGIPRKLNDVVAKAQDLRYDNIEVTADKSAKGFDVQYGYGFRRRKRGQFKSTPPLAQVEEAYYKPPKTTRAFIRGEAIQRDLAFAAKWNGVFLPDTKIYRGLGPVILGKPGSGLERLELPEK